METTSKVYQSLDYTVKTIIDIISFVVIIIILRSKGKDHKY